MRKEGPVNTEVEQEGHSGGKYSTENVTLPRVMIASLYSCCLKCF